MKLSIVTTLYNYSKYIEEFYSRISIEAQKITNNYEIIFVDDGSPDDSLSKAIKLCKKDSHVKVIELSKNFSNIIRVKIPITINIKNIDIKRHTFYMV